MLVYTYARYIFWVVFKCLCCFFPLLFEGFVFSLPCRGRSCQCLFCGFVLKAADVCVCVCVLQTAVCRRSWVDQPGLCCCCCCCLCCCCCWETSWCFLSGSEGWPPHGSLLNPGERTASHVQTAEGWLMAKWPSRWTSTAPTPHRPSHTTTSTRAASNLHTSTCKYTHTPLTLRNTCWQLYTKISATIIFIIIQNQIIQTYFFN